MAEGMVEQQLPLPSALEVSPEDDIFLVVVTAEGFVVPKRLFYGTGRRVTSNSLSFCSHE